MNEEDKKKDRSIKVYLERHAELKVTNKLSYKKAENVTGTDGVTRSLVIFTDKAGILHSWYPQEEQKEDIAAFINLNSIL